MTCINETKKFEQINTKLSATFEKILGKEHYSNNDREVNNLLAQMQDEVKLDKKSAELNAARDKELADRIEKLKENSPIRQNSGIANKKTSSDKELFDRIERLKENNPIRENSGMSNKKTSSDKELFDRIEKLKDNNPVKQKSSKSFSFNDIKSLTSTNLNAQASIASEFAYRSNNTKEVQSLNNLSNTLKEMGSIIDDIPTVPKEYENTVSNIISKGLKTIYEGIKTVISPAVNAIKELGNNLINAIKSTLTESPEKQLQANKENLKGLYKTYVDLKDVDNKVKDKFLKNHYEQIDKLQNPKELLLETAKVTKAIMRAGGEKINNIKQQRETSLKRDRSPNNSLGNISPPNTPNIKVNSPSKDHSK
ncbi:hypothetical protein NOVO_01320 [Rickettsiales bacterium Ac37b]|nr:hypothetical protein NOVO_01320 [Rickettsiales bacterium Ac37b]